MYHRPVRYLSWILFVLGVLWIVWGGFGVVVMVAMQSGESGLWRAPFTLLLGVAAVIGSRRLRR